jgi:murein DD-endopeptidase MepM/ murein hydrolase activator NlpD
MALGSALSALVAGVAVGAASLGAAPWAAPPPPTRSAATSAPAPAATAPVRQGPWSWPLHPDPVVERRFDPPEEPWGAGHRGVDLAATVGQPVRSPEAGTVTWAGVLAGRGVVVVSHSGGLRSTFEPVAATVGVGGAVARGERVGTVTAAPGHCSPRTCLHWGVLRGRQYLDPLAFVGRAPIVLLPLG